MHVTRRQLAPALAALGAVASGRTEEDGCDACGRPERAPSPLAYCIACDAVLHLACAGLLPCHPTGPATWAEMFRDAAPEQIEEASGHELVVVRLKIVA